MSNGDDVLDNWEELDEAGLCMTLQTKLQTANDDDEDSRSSSKPIKPATATSTIITEKNTKMKVLQRPQSLQESSAPAAAAANTAQVPKQIMIAKKPTATAAPTGQSTDGDLNAPVMMVLHKSASEYDAASYANPINNQTVKILRRPAQAEERRDANGMRPKQPIKTLQQREQEYAQARLRILGSAKNPEDDKPATPTTPVSNASTTSVISTPWQVTETTPYANNFNNNNSNNNNNSGSTALGGGNGIGPGPGPAATGMHRSSSAPKMSQSATPMYNYNNYYQAPPPPPQHTPAMSYIYSAPIFQHQRMPPYGAGQAAAAVAVGAPQTANPQQSWSPVVGGTVSAALLRQQSMHSPALHHQQQQQQLQQQQPATAPPQYAHPYNDNVLRLPRGPCPNGTIGFQMRR
ncbi:hypothetical protein KR093_000900 [Drosophila rubida]|uniref:SUZ RNA-binding domain-containing n=1 Tax=Drosophila rubida TaxID=30044 RepID=A0AAD4K3B8_9MUSC|nr:hypothetical protein KR093_000900 [Drosophila rubida]